MTSEIAELLQGLIVSKNFLGFAGLAFRQWEWKAGWKNCCLDEPNEIVLQLAQAVRFQHIFDATVGLHIEGNILAWSP